MIWQSIWYPKSVCGRVYALNNDLLSSGFPHIKKTSLQYGDHVRVREGSLFVFRNSSVWYWFVFSHLYYNHYFMKSSSKIWSHKNHHCTNFNFISLFLFQLNITSSSRCMCQSIWTFAKASWWRHEMEAFSALLALCAGYHRSAVNSTHKG